MTVHTHHSYPKCRECGERHSPGATADCIESLRESLEWHRKETAAACNEMAKARRQWSDAESRIGLAEMIMADPPTNIPPLAVRLWKDKKRLEKELRAAIALADARGRLVDVAMADLDALTNGAPVPMRMPAPARGRGVSND